MTSSLLFFFFFLNNRQAARLMGKANFDILIDDTTMQDCSDVIKVEALPPIKLKGIAGDVPVFRPIRRIGEAFNAERDGAVSSSFPTFVYLLLFREKLSHDFHLVFTHELILQSYTSALKWYWAVVIGVEWYNSRFYSSGIRLSGISNSVQ